MAETTAAALEIARAGEHDVKIRWADGHESVYPARALRLACPCAGCVDETTGQRRVGARDVPQNVVPVKIEPTGNYGMSVRWSDGHRTGIYAFDLLRKLCPCCRSEK
jgi:DUF971 family protein